MMLSKGRAHLFVAASAATLLAAAPARADEPDAAAPTEEKPPETEPTAPAPKSPRVSPVDSKERAKTVVPKAAEPPPPGRPTFSVDPIADGGIIAGAAAFAGILELINGTGEIRPQQISPTFDRSHLLGIDRGAVSQTVDSSASITSSVVLAAAIGYAALDPILTGVREKNVQSALVDAVIYAESLMLTWGVTNLAKIAVRRPRPRAYIDAEAHKGDPNYSNADTDSSLSFFSGHASMTASVAATATYLAFVRSPHSPRPWVTLGVGTALTAFTSFERVRAGAHFPTDVIAGAIAGAGIGVIVAHLHRTEDVQQRRVWVGFAPERGSGGSVQLGGVF